MKKIIITIVMILILSSCTHTPNRIENYIERHCDIEENDSFYFNLSKALGIDYDTMFVFNSLTPLTGVRNIIGKPEFRKCSDPETTLIGKDSEMCIVILIKNNQVVYEDEYYYLDYNLKLLYSNFTIVTDTAIFDDSPVVVNGYLCKNKQFKAFKTKEGHYLVTTISHE